MGVLKDYWTDLGRLSNRVDALGRKVHKVWERPEREGRETPFFAEAKFLIQPNTTEQLETPLVHSAGSVTRVTQLSYSVYTTVTVGVTPNTFSMRSTPRGMVLGRIEDNSEMFDFEWTYTIGSTERKYSTANPSPDGWNWLSRFSLGNPETAGKLLFNPKHPLILRTNEFLTFRIRPIFWANFNASETVQVNIGYAGYRTAGYGV
jgi:hypothetical protein